MTILKKIIDFFVIFLQDFFMIKLGSKMSWEMFIFFHFFFKSCKIDVNSMFDKILQWNNLGLEIFLSEAFIYLFF